MGQALASASSTGEPDSRYFEGGVDWVTFSSLSLHGVTLIVRSVQGFIQTLYDDCPPQFRGTARGGYEQFHWPGVGFTDKSAGVVDGGYPVYLKVPSLTLFVRYNAHGKAVHAYVQIKSGTADAFLTYPPSAALLDAVGVAGGDEGARAHVRVTRFDLQVTASHWEHHHGSGIGGVPLRFPRTVGKGLILDAYHRLKDMPASAFPSKRKRSLGIEGSEDRGYTLYIGPRKKRSGSGLLIRIYDKGAESGGEADCSYRFELEYNKQGDRANAAFLGWYGVYRQGGSDAAIKWVGEVLVGEWLACGSPIPEVFGDNLTSGRIVRGSWEARRVIVSVEHFLEFIRVQGAPQYERVRNAIQEHGDEYGLDLEGLHRLMLLAFDRGNG